jgi:predicted anti-sigma-YlaC factor YlaD
MGLRCRRVRQRCWHYLDGTLSAQARARVERHLVGCGECRAAFAQAAFILESLQKGLPIETDSLSTSLEPLEGIFIEGETRPDGGGACCCRCWWR